MGSREEAYEIIKKSFSTKQTLQQLPKNPKDKEAKLRPKGGEQVNMPLAGEQGKIFQKEKTLNN